VGALGAADCERLRDGLVAQPVNSASSLAYLVVGGWLLGRARRLEPGSRPLALAYGLTVLAAGAGSIDYHGPGSPVEPWLHDLGVVAPLLGVAAGDLARLGVRPALALTGLAGSLTGAGVLLAAVPAAAVPLAAGAAVTVAGLELAAWRRGSGHGVPARRVALAALAAGAVLDVLGRTGRPLCDPDSLLQGHAAWHVLTALALGAWALASQPGPGPPGQPAARIQIRPTRS
jgi:hypothetical protein